MLRNLLTAAFCIALVVAFGNQLPRYTPPESGAAHAAPFHSPDGVSVLEANALTVSTANYVAGDLIGTHTGGKLIFENAARVIGGSGQIYQACLVDLSDAKRDTELLLFSSDPSGTTFTDNAALDIADTDAPKLLGSVQFLSTAYRSFADNGMVCNTGGGLLYTTSATSSLYGALVARQLITPAAATDFTIRLFVRRS